MLIVIKKRNCDGVGEGWMGVEKDIQEINGDGKTETKRRSYLGLQKSFVLLSHNPCCFLLALQPWAWTLV